ncbi:MAG: glucokinase [Spirochaetales bacterium]|nr:glucokinase [Spirochaetales bacterium]
MEVKWIDAGKSWDDYILSGDIGGTNTNIALVGRTGRTYRIILKIRFESTQIVEFAPIIRTTLDVIKEKNTAFLPSKCCLCAAGPIRENRSSPTNLIWHIDGNALAREFSFPVIVINDFQAICLALPLLDTDDRTVLLPVPHTDGLTPAPTGETKAVAGAGTGLGVGLLTKPEGKYISLPSEGGHTDFAPFDEETEELCKYVARRYDAPPGAELFLSGRGMTEIFKFYRDRKKIKLDGVLETISGAKEEDIPPLISRYAGESIECRNMMKLFFRIFGNFASRVSLFFLPHAGMFLAGGIIIRHANLVLEDDTFMQVYENNYNGKIREVLKHIPVYILKDYSISLLGAAHAAVSHAT